MARLNGDYYEDYSPPAYEVAPSSVIAKNFSFREDGVDNRTPDNPTPNDSPGGGPTRQNQPPRSRASQPPPQKQEDPPKKDEKPPKKDPPDDFERLLNVVERLFGQSVNTGGGSGEPILIPSSSQKQSMFPLLIVLSGLGVVGWYLYKKQKRSE